MEGNSEISPGSEWEKLPVFGLSFHNLGTGSSSKNPDSASVYSFPPCNLENITRMQNINETISSSSNATASSSEPIFSLWPGKQIENRDVSSVSVSSMTTRMTRVSQNPSCQVEGCNIDLTLAKEYHRRHRICEGHSKSPKVIVAGLERRFCQQCSRFHNLSEFDDKKRSCRRRLSVHNARRRRLQPESIQLSSGLSSALYDRRPPNLLLSGHAISAPNSTWEDTGNFILRQATNSLFSQTNGAGFRRTLPFSSDEISSSISNLPLSSERLSLTQSSTPRVLENYLNGRTAISQMTPDLQSAHSLLSPTSWSLNEAQSTSKETLVHGNYNSVPAGFQFDNMSAEQGHNVHSVNFDHMSAEQGHNVHSVNLHDAGPSHMQEFHLFKDTYEQSSCFYSSQRNS